METFAVYPNPVQEALYIELKEFMGEQGIISVSSIYGQIIHQQTVESVAGDALRLSLHDFVRVRIFALFPNPAQAEITIDLNEYAGEQAAISISNMYGQIVQQKRIASIPFEAIRLPLTNFVNGFYFVHIKLANRRLRSEKFLVKRMY